MTCCFWLNKILCVGTYLPYENKQHGYVYLSVFFYDIVHKNMAVNSLKEALNSLMCVLVNENHI